MARKKSARYTCTLQNSEPEAFSLQMSIIIYYFSEGFNVYEQKLSSVNSRVQFLLI